MTDFGALYSGRPSRLRALSQRKSRPAASGRKADVHVSVLNSRLGGAKLANIRHLRLVGSRLPDSDAAKRDVEMFISQKEGRMSHILTIDPAQLGPIQRSGDRASVVQPMLDLMRQAR